MHDVARMAIPSDLLRGEGQRPLTIKDLEPGGEMFQSSGTTGKDPVRIYRSPLDLALMLKANTDLSATQVAEKALRIAGDICVFTNGNITVEEV